jgi:hypothetical protein
MQNWLKMESSKSSVAVLPTISPTALAAMRKSIAAKSSVASRSASSVHQRRRARAVQRVLMPRVDHHLQHLGLDFARPGQFLDGVFQRFHPLPAQTANVNNDGI